MPGGEYPVVSRQLRMVGDILNALQDGCEVFYVKLHSGIDPKRLKWTSDRKRFYVWNARSDTGMCPSRREMNNPRCTPSYIPAAIATGAFYAVLPVEMQKIDAHGQLEFEFEVLNYWAADDG